MRIVIAGAGAVGSHLAEIFSKEDVDCVVIDEDKDAIEDLGNLDIRTVNEDPVSIPNLNLAGVKECDLFVAVTAHEPMNLACCAMAKRLGAKKTVARIDNFDHLRPKYDKVSKPLFEDMGIDQLIYPEVLAAKEIVKGLQVSWARQRWDLHDGSLVLLGIKLRDDKCQLLNQPLRNLIGPQDPYHVVAIKRKEETIIPGGNDSLMNLDLVYFIAESEHLDQLKEKAGKQDYVDVKNIIIMGGSKTAVRLAQTLPENMHANLIEKDRARCERLSELITNKDVTIMEGDGRNLDVLNDAGLETSQAFVALTGNTEANILACLNAKRAGVRKTVAMVQNIDYIGMAESLDIGTLVNKQVLAAGYISQMLLDESVKNLQNLMMGNAQVGEFEAQKNSKVTKKPVKDLALPKNCTIGGLVREGKGQLVSGGTQIQEGDKVMVFSIDMNLEKVGQMFAEPKGLFNFG